MIHLTQFNSNQETYERERMEHGRTLERLDAFKTKQQRQQMMQQQEQQQIRELHKDSLTQILGLEERIRQFELQGLTEEPPPMMMPTTTTTNQKCLTDQQKFGTTTSATAMRSAGKIGGPAKRGEEVRFEG